MIGEKRGFDLMFRLILPVFLTLSGIALGNSALEDAVDKAMEHLKDGLETGMVSLPSKTTVALVAVRRGEERDRDAEKMISTRLWKISKQCDFILLDREYTDERIRELDMSVSDLVDPKNAPKIGKFLGAFHLIVGEVKRRRKLMEIYEEIWLRLVETERGKVKWETLVRGYPHRTPLPAALLSLTLPGAGQLLNGRIEKSGVFLTVASCLAGGVVIYHLRYSDLHDKYLKATNIDDINRYYEESRKPYKRRSYFLGLYSIWAAISSAEAYYEAKRCEGKRARKRPYLKANLSPAGVMTLSLRIDL